MKIIEVGGSGSSDKIGVVVTDRAHSVANLGELEALLASGVLNSKRTANTRDVINFTNEDVITIDRAFDVPYDNIKVQNLVGGSFVIPNESVLEYAFQFGASCEFLIDIEDLTEGGKAWVISTTIGGTSGEGGGGSEPNESEMLKFDPRENALTFNVPTTEEELIMGPANVKYDATRKGIVITFDESGVPM